MFGISEMSALMTNIKNLFATHSSDSSIHLSKTDRQTIDDIVDGKYGTQSDWNVTDTSSAAYIKNKPTIPNVPEWAMSDEKPTYTASEVGALPSSTEIPNELSDLSDDATHRVVTDTQISAWNAKANAATTLSGYGITDAATSTQGAKADSAIQTVKINNVEQTKTNGIVNLPAYPTTLPASDVKAWAKSDTKPTYTASEVGALPSTTTHLSGDISTEEKGSANGVATLGSDGKIPSSQLPSFVDDVLEGTIATFPVPGETGKVYVDTNTNKTYRWSGTSYIVIGTDLALGETSSTAYAGDKGKAVTDKVDGHVADTTIHISSSERTSWNAKQSALSETQLSAVNSGITASKVATYDGYASEIAGKVDASSGKGLSSNDFTDAEKTKLSGIATGATANIGTITEIKMNGSSKGTSGVVDLGTVITSHQDISGKQDKLSDAQLAAANSGITSTKVSTYDGYASTISGKVDKVSGKGLSTNDFTNSLKNKLDGIAENATANIGTITSVVMNGTTVGTSGAVNLGTVITAHQDISGKANTSDLATVATSGKYSDLSGKPTIPTVTDTYSATSSNAMSGKAVASAISGKANTADLPSSYAPVNAEKNIIVGIQKNGTDLSVDSTTRKVNITVPIVTDTYSATSSNAMSGKAVASAISSVGSGIEYSATEPTTKKDKMTWIQ